MPTYTVHVRDEPSMAAPDIICVVVRDQNINKGGYESGVVGEAGALNSTQLGPNPNKGGANGYYRVGGANKSYRYFFAENPTEYLDRDAADDPASYAASSLGGRTVTAVYRESRMYDQGSYTASGGTPENKATFEHRLFLELDGDLPEGGPYTIDSAGTFHDVEFSYSDRETRAEFIHATQVGHRHADGEKSARVAAWIPKRGRGAVDYAGEYGLETFEIIDAVGATVYGPADLELLADEDTVAFEGDLPTGVRYTSSDPTEAWHVSNITTAAAGAAVVTYTGGTGHPSNGDLLMLIGIGGMRLLTNLQLNINGSMVEVTSLNTGARTFIIGSGSIEQAQSSQVAWDGATTRWAAFNGAQFLSTHAYWLYRTYISNRHATSVYKADYSDFNPDTSGTFRVRVPGLGCSWPFKIDEAVHYKAAQTHMKGFYNQCYGTALSSAVGGWDRPINFKNGTNGVTILETNFPAVLDAQNTDALPSGVTLPNSRDVENVEWVGASPTTATGFWSSLSDAGDWDFHIDRHAIMAWYMLNVYAQLPEASRDVHLGFPKMSTMVGSPYADIDSLGDLVHMSIWILEPYRRTQKSGGVVDGHVYSGFQVDGDGAGVAGGGADAEPSWDTQQQGTALAGDHSSAYTYAQCAAKIGYTLNEAGFTTEGALWVDSAERAFAWADNLRQDYIANGATGPDIQAYYVTLRGIKTAMSWNDATFATFQAGIHTLTTVRRRQALASLWLATDDYASYGQELNELGIGAMTMSGLELNAIVDYCAKEPDYDAAHTARKAYYEPRFITTAASAYSDFLATGGVAPFTSAVASDFMAMLAFWQGPQTQDDEYLRFIHGLQDFRAGVNLNGLTTTVGLGSRPPVCSLIRDREAMQLPTETVVGTTLYMWTYNNYPQLAFNNFKLGGSTANFTNIAPTTTAEINTYVDPLYTAVPSMMGYWPNTYVIYSTEFTIQTTIQPQVQTAVMRHAWDGNTQTEYATETVRARLKLAA
jgi:hypothetical protein